MTKTTLIGAVVLLAFGIALGWWIGSLNSEVEERETVRYVSQTPTTIYLKEPQPISVKPIELPSIQYRDSVLVPIPADTASIIADYLKRREYELDYSTDTTGTFKVRAIVEANRLASAEATIVPLQREIERVVELKPRKFRPYIGGGVGIGDNITASLQVGALINNKHLPSVGYQRFGSSNYITLNYGYIFEGRRNQ